MKKSIYTLVALAALVSCVKENGNIGREASAPSVQLTIHADQVKTSISLDEQSGKYIPSWSANDALGVLVDDFAANKEAADGTLANASAGTTATFSGDVTGVEDGTHTAYAFYPARAFYGTESGKTLGLEIPYIQFPSAVSFDPKADLLVGVPKQFTVSSAVASDIDNMQFRRIPAIVKVTLVDNGAGISSDQIRSVKLESGSSYLTGKFRYDFAGGDAASDQMEAAASFKHVTADFTESPMAFAGNAIYLLVNPCTLTASTTLTVKVITDHHEVVKVSTLPADLVLESGAVKPLTVKLNSTDTVEEIYFEDGFDWLYKFWDGPYPTAYAHMAQKDQVAEGAHDDTSQKNIWSDTYSNTIGKAFTDYGYDDLVKNNKAMYALENYVKLCKSANQTGLILPAMDLGAVPVNVTLSFDFVKTNNRQFVVEVLNCGTCSDSGLSVSIPFAPSTSWVWTNKTLTLIGLTDASRICIRPDVEDFNTEGQYRCFIDNIKVVPAPQTPAPFPVQWSFPSTMVEDVDYHLQSESQNGSFAYSDTHHQGKLFVHRTSDKAISGKTPTLIVRSDAKDVDGETALNERMFLHYGIGKDDYWEFDVYNVNNVAGTYYISFKMCSSANGAKHFRIEYTLDDEWPATPDVAISDTGDGEYDSVYYSYQTPNTNVAVQANAHFHLDAMNEFKTLKVRAIVVTKVQCAGDGSLSNNTTATNRMLGSPTISFVAD